MTNASSDTPGWQPNEESAGRQAFRAWRDQLDYSLRWGWFDMAEWERQEWIAHAKTEAERGSAPKRLAP